MIPWRPAIHTPPDPWHSPTLCGERSCTHRAHTLPLGTDPMQGSALAYDQDERAAIEGESR